MTPAAKLQAYIRSKTRLARGEYRKVQWVSRRGAPDCLLDFGFPNVAWVEVKAGDDVLSILQRREIKRLRGRGWRVFVVRTRADADAVVEEMKNAR